MGDTVSINDIRATPVGTQLEMFSTNGPSRELADATHELNEIDRRRLDIDATLQERGQRYGSFDEHARITQELKYIMFGTPNWPRLSVDKKEALDMIAHKIGRILNGDPNYKDSWTDIVGYARLVEKAL